MKQSSHPAGLLLFCNCIFIILSINKRGLLQIDESNFEPVLICTAAWLKLSFFWLEILVSLIESYPAKKLCLPRFCFFLVELCRIIPSEATTGDSDLVCIVADRSEVRVGVSLAFIQCSPWKILPFRFLDGIFNYFVSRSNGSTTEGLSEIDDENSTASTIRKGAAVYLKTKPRTPERLGCGRRRVVQISFCHKCSGKLTR